MKGLIGAAFVAGALAVAGPAAINPVAELQLAAITNRQSHCHQIPESPQNHENYPLDLQKTQTVPRPAMSTAKSISRMVSRQGILCSNGIVRSGQVGPAKPPPGGHQPT